MARRGRAKGRRSLISAVEGPDEIRAAVLAMKRADKDLRKDINARTRATMGPEWTQGLADHVTRTTDRVILAGARIAAGNPPQLVAGNSKRKVGRALVPVENWPLWEYGTNQHYRHEYTRRSKGGGTHTVKRDTMAGQRRRSRTGYVIGPTVATLLPRLASLWVQTIVRTYLDALDERK